MLSLDLVKQPSTFKFLLFHNIFSRSVRGVSWRNTLRDLSTIRPNPPIYEIQCVRLHPLSQTWTQTCIKQSIIENTTNKPEHYTETSCGNKQAGNQVTHDCRVLLKYTYIIDLRPEIVRIFMS